MSEDDIFKDDLFSISIVISESLWIPGNLSTTAVI